MTSKPIVGVARLTNPDLMAKIVRLVRGTSSGPTRPSIADPFLTQKIAEPTDEIRECTGSNVCLMKVDGFGHLVAMVLALAKAVVESGYQPEYTWIFAPVTGEEYGLADAYYDWLQGAFYRITVSHTEWQTDTVAILNWELHSPPYFLGASLLRELRPFVAGSLGASQEEGLIEGFYLSEVYAWQDNFTCTAEGAPAVTFGASGYDYFTRYHTDYDSIGTAPSPSRVRSTTRRTRRSRSRAGPASTGGRRARCSCTATSVTTRSAAASSRSRSSCHSSRPREGATAGSRVASGT